MPPRIAPKAVPKRPAPKAVPRRPALKATPKPAAPKAPAGTDASILAERRPSQAIKNRNQDLLQGRVRNQINKGKGYQWKAAGYSGDPIQDRSRETARKLTGNAGARLDAMKKKLQK
jgi:hypothetical protein